MVPNPDTTLTMFISLSFLIKEFVSGWVHQENNRYMFPENIYQMLSNM